MSTEQRPCEQCGKELVKRKGESNPRFRRRVFCSNTCRGASRMKGPVLCDMALSYRALKFRKGSCESCGATHPLVVHHIDKNRVNNQEGNLETLCRSCHNKLHWADGSHEPRPRTYCRVCGDPAHGHGLCVKHYKRWYRHGDVGKRDTHGRPVKETS